MKDKKGFTLIELICVITLLAIIMTIAYPNFSSLTSKAKGNYDNTRRVMLQNALQLFVDNNREEVDQYLATHDKLCVPLEKLIVYEYIDKADVPSDDENKDINRKCFYVFYGEEKQNGKYKYKFDLDSNDYISSSEDITPPVIYLKNKTITPCKKVMKVSSIEEFNNLCEAKSDEGTPNLTKIQNDNRIILEYNITDSSGNKALPFKVTLIIE